MKRNIIFKTMTVSLVGVLATVSLTSCTLWGKGNSVDEPAIQTTTEAPASPTVNPETAIIGKWEVSKIQDKDNNEISISDIDLSTTPLANYSSVIKMVMKKGVTVEFKSDNTIPLVVTTGKYEIVGNALKISVPSLATGELAADFEINDSALTLSLGGYTVTLTKQA